MGQILKKLNLPPAGLHAFHHGCVSVLQASGVPGDLIMEWIGHSNPRTTSGYTHFQNDFHARIAGKVGLFARENVAEELPVGPNGPNSAGFAALVEAR